PAAASPEHDIAAIAPRPVLLVHGTADGQIPVEQAVQLQQAGGETVELAIVDGADHLVFRGDGTGPEDAEFRQRILDFLARSLPAPE
ncbi:MAG TPA: prolyl oligopeptidase family serine peptidase, partial [Anaerolineaceae bacterium]|nr:prolyl oligopeptidase family serine peptidase [Anaerolineaceae bacterium]